MKRIGLITLACFALILLSPILFRKRTIPLVSNGNVVAAAKCTFMAPWSDGQVDVYAGNKKFFSLWTDFFDGPVFVYPFADGQRFLCDFDDDTAMLDFVVDFRGSVTNGFSSFDWPTNDYVRDYMARRMTNVVMETSALVRLPTVGELKEIKGDLAGWSNRRFYSQCIPFHDLGFYRVYTSKEFLLEDLSANRQSVW